MKVQFNGGPHDQKVTELNDIPEELQLPDPLTGKHAWWEGVIHTYNLKGMVDGVVMYYLERSTYRSQKGAL